MTKQQITAMSAVLAIAVVTGPSIFRAMGDEYPLGIKAAAIGLPDDVPVAGAAESEEQ